MSDWKQLERGLAAAVLLGLCAGGVFAAGFVAGKVSSASDCAKARDYRLDAHRESLRALRLLREDTAVLERITAAFRSTETTTTNRKD
jgi:hypothetical protein